jgi:hypothetical protein
MRAALAFLRLEAAYRAVTFSHLAGDDNTEQCASLGAPFKEQMAALLQSSLHSDNHCYEFLNLI